VTDILVARNVFITTRAGNLNNPFRVSSARYSESVKFVGTDTSFGAISMTKRYGVSELLSITLLGVARLNSTQKSILMKSRSPLKVLLSNMSR